MFEKAEQLRSELVTRDKNKSVEIAQLVELLEMQEALDKAILANKNITEYPKEKIEIALFVELGELLNELPSKFKYWKETAEDNREKALVEYVDCLHFALSLTNYYASRILKAFDEGSLDEKDYRYGIDTGFSEFDLNYLIQETTSAIDELTIGYLFDIGKIIGFTWDEIYKAYKDKNTVNYQRLKEGY